MYNMYVCMLQEIKMIRDHKELYACICITRVRMPAIRRVPADAAALPPLVAHRPRVRSKMWATSSKVFYKVAMSRSRHRHRPHPTPPSFMQLLILTDSGHGDRHPPTYTTHPL